MNVNRVAPINAELKELVRTWAYIPSYAKQRSEGLGIPGRAGKLWEGDQVSLVNKGCLLDLLCKFK